MTKSFYVIKNGYPNSDLFGFPSLAVVWTGRALSHPAVVGDLPGKKTSKIDRHGPCCRRYART